MVIPILYGIFDKLHKFISDPKSKGTGVQFARKLLSSLQQRFPQYLTELPNCVCTFLDPRFKNVLFDAAAMIIIQTELEEFLPQILSNMSLLASSESTQSSASATTAVAAAAATMSTTNNEIVTTEEPAQSSSSASTSCHIGSGTSGSLWDSIDQLTRKSRSDSRTQISVSALTQEIEAYKEDPPIERDASPLGWWSDNANRYKTLALLARAFLCVSATQTKSERLNSTSGHIVEDRRTRLLTQHVTELTFLHENLIL